MQNKGLRVALFLLPALLIWLAGCAGAGVDGPALIGDTIATLAAGPARDASPVPDATIKAPTATAIPLDIGLAANPTAKPQPTATRLEPTATLEPTARFEPTPTAGAPHEPTVEPAIYIGDSAGGRPLSAYRFGAGDIPVILVGGMHGGYEWNTILLAQAFIDYFRAREAEIPAAITLHIVPNANPDGLAAVAATGPDGSFQATDVISGTLNGRFNANGVDLNRNWDCNWTEQALWRDQTVSAGAYPFSEPESESLRRFFLELDPALVIFLHSAADAVYVSGCPEPGPTSAALAAVYGLAAGYPVYPVFDHYPITGDAGDWLVSQGIPSFTVELTNHEDIEWEQNLAGLAATLAYFSEERHTEQIQEQ